MHLTDSRMRFKETNYTEAEILNCMTSYDSCDRRSYELFLENLESALSLRLLMII